MIKILKKLILLFDQLKKNQDIVSQLALLEFNEQLLYLGLDFSKLFRAIKRATILVAENPFPLDTLLAEQYIPINLISADLRGVTQVIPYILDKRKKFLLSNEEIEDKERRVREGEQQNIIHLYLESLSLFEKINERLGIELIPQNELQKRKRGIEKMEQDVYEFTAYLNTMERAIPQNKKEAKQFLLCINSFLVKIYQEADAMDNLCNIIAERYRFYYQKTEAIG